MLPKTLTNKFSDGENKILWEADKFNVKVVLNLL